MGDRWAICAGSAFSQGEENRLHLGTGSAGGRRKSIQGRGQIAQTLQTLHFLLPTHAAAHQHHHRNTDALVGRSVQQETCAGLAPASCEHLRLALAHTATCTAATVPAEGTVAEGKEERQDSSPFTFGRTVACFQPLCAPFRFAAHAALKRALWRLAAIPADHPQQLRAHLSTFGARASSDFGLGCFSLHSMAHRCG